MQYIDSVEQLRKVAHQLRAISFVRKLPDYQFDIPELSAEVNQKASQVMNKYKNECGCFTGGLFMGISVISVISYYLISSQSVSDVGLKHLIFFIVLISGGALTGKMIGLLWARFRMVQLVRATLALTNKNTNPFS